METMPLTLAAGYRTVVVAPGVWLVLARDDPAAMDHATGVIQRLGSLFEVKCKRFPLERTYCPSLDDAFATVIARAR